MIPAGGQIDVLKLRKALAHRFAIGTVSQNIRLNGEYAQGGVLNLTHLDSIHGAVQVLHCGSFAVSQTVSGRLPLTP